MPSLGSASAAAARIDSRAGSPLLQFPGPRPAFSSTPSASGSNVSGGRGVADSEMLIFSYLLRFVHREGRTGDLARTGLLFLMELAMGRRFLNPSTAHSVGGVDREKRGHRRISSLAQNQTQSQADAALTLGEWVLDSDFSDVLAAGLGAAYGLLPSKLSIRHPEDKTSMAMADRMALEGFDAPEDEPDEEDAEDEETRMKGLGLGFSSSPEFKFQFDLFVKILEFTQDVLRRAPPSIALALSPPPPMSPPLVGGMTSDTSSVLSSPSVMLDPSSGRPAELVAGAITNSVLASIRKLFLTAILYPSLLESSDNDGSAVAVMSYLEAMLTLLESDGRLADSVLRFLMADEDEDAPSKGGHSASAKGRASVSPSPQSKRLREKRNRRKSGALQLIQAEAKKARRGDDKDGDYFTSLGRFTLQDLLVANISSSDPATVTAALKLLHTILTRHDRYALGLLNVVPDAKATTFPFPPPDPAGEDIVVPAPMTAEAEEDSDDEFVYPATAPGSSATLKTPHKSTLGGAATTTTPFRTPAKADIDLAGRILASPAPTYAAHQDDVDGLTQLIDEIDPSIDDSLDPLPSSSTAFERYLDDAEEQVLANASFRRYLVLDPASPNATLTSHRPTGEASANPFASHPAVQDLVDDPLLRHRLSVEAPLVAALLECLADFFSHPPEVNLALTGVLATLASCPTRSLEGWLVPRRSERAAGPLDEYIGKSRNGVKGEGDDRSVDFVVDELSRVSLGRSALDEEDTEEPAVVDILRQLAEQVSHHRENIRHFDRYLKERKQGLLFAENLADALDPGELGDVSLPTIAVGHEPEEEDDEVPASPPKPALKPSTSWTAFFTPTKKPSPASAAPPQTTPENASRTLASAQMARRSTGSSSTSKASSKATLRPGSEGLASPELGRHRLSPFAKHYEQTRAVKVAPMVAMTPASRKKALRRAEVGGPPGAGLDTPTKKTFNASQAATLPSSSIADEDDGDEDEEEEGEEEAERGPAASEVSLSMLLGNVVVLEESIKELAAIISSRTSLGIDPIRLF